MPSRVGARRVGRADLARIFDVAAMTLQLRWYLKSAGRAGDADPLGRGATHRPAGAAALKNAGEVNFAGFLVIAG
jgi:hypothetical protein